MKKFKDSHQTAARNDRTKVAEAVADILESVRTGGIAALRQFSQKIDNWSPSSFQLSDHEIDSCVARVPQDVKDDLLFAQTQIRASRGPKRHVVRQWV